MLKIALSQGKYALVDDKDYKYLKQFNWSYHNAGYAVRRNGNKMLLMHRDILKQPSHLITDHTDGNRLNNQRSNLRICTQKNNLRNRTKSLNKSSIFKGVSKVTRNEKYLYWEAKIEYNQKQIKIGYFKSEIHAAVAYDLWATDLFGEFAKTNFPVVKGGDLYS